MRLCLFHAFCGIICSTLCISANLPLAAWCRAHCNRYVGVPPILRTFVGFVRCLSKQFGLFWHGSESPYVVVVESSTQQSHDRTTWYHRTSAKIIYYYFQCASQHESGIRNQKSRYVVIEIKATLKQLVNRQFWADIVHTAFQCCILLGTILESLWGLPISNWWCSVVRFAGSQCSCGAWVTPAFHIQNGKVDKCKPLTQASSPHPAQNLVLPSASTWSTSAHDAGFWRHLWFDVK